MLTKTLTAWELGANYPYVPLQSRAAETGQILNGLMENIPAQVPGCVHNDLLRAGKIPDPYFEMNSLLCAWVEQYWWTYTTAFTLDEVLKGRHLRLHMKGIDYEGTVTLNRTCCGSHVGMYTPFKADITDLVKFGEENQLSVLLKNAPAEMGQIGLTSRTHTQKARFPYKWDFSTRLVQLGLYDQVLIEDFGRAAIEYTRVDTSLQDRKGIVRTESELTVFDPGEVTVTCTVSLDGETVATDRRRVCLSAGVHTVACQAEVENPRLWWPSGMGEHPVYDVRITLEDEGGLSDEKTQTAGFCTKQYCRAEGAGEECLPYSVIINGKQTYIKGVNMVPFDIMYGRVENETVERFLQMARDANINMVRIWGGGLIESEYFYDLCDRYGLMVWQEFIQSSSGMDNVPSKDPEFLRLCRATAIHAVRTKQHHPSMTFWCGGNELQDEHNVPCTFADENLAMLRDIVQQYDGKTFMLPTSATGYFECLNVRKPGMNLDVHGPWKYAGPERHYYLFNLNDSQLHSEFGVDGMNDLETIQTVLSEKNLRVQSMDNAVWRYHGEMWDTLGRDEEIFGPLPEEELEVFVRSSQFIQAEGIRYAIEANRRRAFANVGSLIWQFNEPWPNVACTNVVDYYGRKKLAYYGLKLAFRDAYPSLRYDKLTYDAGEEAAVQLFMTSELETGAWEVTAHVTDAAGQALLEPVQTTVTTGDGRSAKAADLVIPMPAAGAAILDLTARQGDTVRRNRYILFVKNEQGYADRQLMLDFAPCIRDLAEEA